MGRKNDELKPINCHMQRRVSEGQGSRKTGKGKGDKGARRRRSRRRWRSRRRFGRIGSFPRARGPGRMLYFRRERKKFRHLRRYKNGFLSLRES